MPFTSFVSPADGIMLDVLLLLLLAAGLLLPAVGLAPSLLLGGSAAALHCTEAHSKARHRQHAAPQLQRPDRAMLLVKPKQLDEKRAAASSSTNHPAAHARPDCSLAGRMRGRK